MANISRKEPPVLRASAKAISPVAQDEVPTGQCAAQGTICVDEKRIHRWPQKCLAIAMNRTECAMFLTQRINDRWSINIYCTYINVYCGNSRRWWQLSGRGRRVTERQ